jgi:hypothetical protein
MSVLKVEAGTKQPIWLKMVRYPIEYRKFSCSNELGFF